MDKSLTEYERSYTLEEVRETFKTLLQINMKNTMSKKEIIWWYMGRGYTVQLRKNTTINSHWYRKGDANSEIVKEEGYSSKPYDYEFLERLIKKGDYERLNLYK